jgi:hypothetical protein
VKHRPLRPDQEPLSKAEVVTAMNELRPAAAACGTRFGVQGVVMLNVTFKANGAVRAEVTGRHAGTACARFIEDAASRLRVRRSAGLTTPYPFMVR